MKNKNDSLRRCQCVYFRTDSGRMPAKEFVDSLDQRSQQKFFEVVGLLENYGRSLPEPHSKYLKDEIFELRFSGIEGRIRILYFFYHEEKAVLTNGLVKKKGPVPKREIETARRRMKSYLERQINK